MEQRKQQLFFQEEINMTIINKYAPIIPFEELGGIKLYSTIDELRDILSLNNVDEMILHNKWLRYSIQDCIELFFHLKNKKLFRILTLDGYKGKLWGEICVGTTEKEMLAIEPSFVYNEMEEVWESQKGVFIEMDAEKNTAMWISIYIKELDSKDFDDANW